MISEKFKEEIYAFLGPQGAMLSNSKSGYCKNNPENIAYFNANICVLHETKSRILTAFGLNKVRAEKIWWGDFDLTKNYKALKNLSEAIGMPVVLINEMDGRFEAEEEPRWERYIYRVNPNGNDFLGNHIKHRVMITEDAVEWITVNNTVVAEGTIENSGI
jgi:hypothetical protein